MSDNRNDAWIQVGRYLSLATLLPAASFVGYLMGYGLDHLFGTRFLGIVFLILGAIGGFVNLLRQLNRDK
jgi:F0F1-type ATP synthase assembly protein I